MFRQILSLGQPYRPPDVETDPQSRGRRICLDFADDSWPKVYHQRHIIKKIPSPNPNEHSYRISLTELQQLHLRQLQRKLLQHAVDLRHRPLEPQGWADDLRQYVQALQDFDYMKSFVFEPNDPFVITGERCMDRNMLKAAMDGLEHRNASMDVLKSVGNWEDEPGRPAPIAGTRDESLTRAQLKAFRDRIALALLGASFLIAPMWLMVLHNTLYTALVSTTVFIFVFGFLMAISLGKPMDVMASTAAYAAVLVVFVGLTADSSNSGNSA